MTARTADQKIKSMQLTAMVLTVLEYTIAGLALYAPAAFSFWIGLGELAIVVPVYFLFLITLTFGPIARSLRLAFTIGTMIIANTSLIIGLFANEYRWMQFKDGAIGYWDALYFSTVTWTTLGYGDIVPLKHARGFAAAEALTGYLIMGLLVAALSIMAQRK